MRRFQFLGAFLLICALAACQNSEEQAEGHYQSALELLDAGDFARAQIEFRNVFQLNGNHREARVTYASALRARGDINEAYGQFLRVVEQFPDDIDGRIALSEMAIGLGNLDEARRHGSAAIELAPDDPRIPPIALGLEYAEALAADDALARDAVAARIADLTAATPEGTLLLQRLLISDAARNGDAEGALTAIDAALAINGDDRFLLDMRLAALAELRRNPELEAHLLQMIEQFPQDRELVPTLLRFYLGQDRDADAIAFLRGQAGVASDPELQNELLSALVQLRLEREGATAALEEIDRIRTERGAPSLTLELAEASLRFHTGDEARAIADLEAMLEGDLPDVDIARIRVLLAVMADNPVGAQAQVDRALEADPSNIEALKMQSIRLIGEDETDRAISLLRTALDIRPGDVEALTLMAQAHARNGDRDLGREFLLLAVEASNSAPGPTLRYAENLIGEDRLLAAVEHVITALRLSPDHPDLLIALGDIYIRMRDWPRAEQVERSLRASGMDALVRQAEAMQAERLAAQNRTDEALSLIEDFASESGLEDTGAQIAVIRARLVNGDVQGALDFGEALVADAPDNLNYRFALAATYGAVGDFDAAEAGFRAILADDPSVAQAWISLIRLLNDQGRGEEAAAVLEEGLAAQPDALDLLWARASMLEQAGDIDGAISIYEQMYTLAPNSPVVANNLASLLSSYRDDEASLERAWTVARRLRGLDVAPFQDTYGWIAYRRGDLNTALAHLEPAAAGLAEDPLVQYHLGMTYLGLERRDEALAQLRHAVAMAGADGRAQFETAREAIAQIEAAIAAAEEAEAQ